MLLQRANAGAGRHAVIRAGFWRLTATGTASLFGLCSLALVAHASGPALFGQYAFALWLSTTVAIAAGTRMPTLSSRMITEILGRTKHEMLASTFYLVLLWHCRKMALYSVLFLLLTIPCARFFGTNTTLPLLLLAMISTLPQLSYPVVTLPLRWLHRFDLQAAIHLLGAVITPLVVLLILQTTATAIQQVYLFLLAPVVAGVLTAGTSLLCAGKLLPLKQPPRLRAELQQPLVRGLHKPLLPVMLDAIVWQHAELIVVGRAGSAFDLGCYMLCMIASTGTMRTLPVIYTTCILPFRLRLMPYRHSFNAVDAYTRTTLGLAWLALPICTLGIICCPALIGLCFGVAYLPAVRPMQILLGAAAFGSISSISVTRLAADERSRAQTRLSTVGAALTLGLAYPLIARAGITGAAIASAIGQGVCATGTMCICIQKMRSRKAA